MKKILKYLLIIFGVLAIIYTAAWYCARLYVTSTVTENFTTNEVIFHPSKPFESIEISGFPFNFNINLKGTGGFEYLHKNIPNKYYLEASDIKVNYTVFSPFKADASWKMVTLKPTHEGATPIKIQILQGHVHYDHNAKNPNNTKGPQVKTKIESINLQTQRGTCFASQNNEILSQMDLNSETTNSSWVSWTSQAGLREGCKALTPPTYHSLTNLVHTRFSDVNIKLEATSMKNKISKGEDIDLTLSGDDAQQNNLFLTKLTLKHDPKVNEKGLFNGSARVTLNQIMNVSPEKKKKKKNELLGIVFDSVMKKVEKSISKNMPLGTQKGQYVLDFTIKDNIPMPSQQTMMRLTQHILN